MNRFNWFSVTRASTMLLLVALVAQIGYSYANRPASKYAALWVDKPANIAQANKLAERIVVGKVVKVQRAKDLVVKVRGEPNGVVRIPVEVVTLKVSKTIKGSASGKIKVFHTGLSVGTPVIKRRPPTGRPPKKPVGAVERPASLPRPGSEFESRTVMLHDDPSYKKGEKYLLFLRKGPTLKVRGRRVLTQAMISPEGRYRVTTSDKIVPMVKRGFAGQLQGTKLNKLEVKIRQTMVPDPGMIRQPRILPR